MKKSLRFQRVKLLLFTRLVTFAAITFTFTNIVVSLLGPSYIFEQLQLWYPSVRNEIDYEKSIDIISIGTIRRPEWQHAQQNTFVLHSSVRNFQRINELNDTDRDCSTRLTQQQFNRILQFCTRRDEQQSRIATLFGTERMDFNPKNATGWLCAQKRPIDGLYKTLQPYILHQQQKQQLLRQ